MISFNKQFPWVRVLIGAICVMLLLFLIAIVTHDDISSQDSTNKLGFSVEQSRHKVPDFSFGLISDEQYSATKPRVGRRVFDLSLNRSKIALEIWRRTLTRVGGQTPMIFHGGDYVEGDGGEGYALADIAAINDATAQFPGRHHFVLGNHDMHTKLLKQDILDLYHGGNQHQAYYAFTTQGIRFVALDVNYFKDGESFSPRRKPPPWTITHVNAEQLTWFEEELKMAVRVQTPVVLKLHSNLGNSNPQYNLNNEKDVIALCNKHKAVWFGFAGHYHEGKHVARGTHGIPFEFWMLKGVIESQHGPTFFTVELVGQNATLVQYLDGGAPKRADLGKSPIKWQGTMPLVKPFEAFGIMPPPQIEQFSHILTNFPIGSSKGTIVAWFDPESMHADPSARSSFESSVLAESRRRIRQHMRCVAHEDVSHPILNDLEAFWRVPNFGLFPLSIANAPKTKIDFDWGNQNSWPLPYHNHDRGSGGSGSKERRSLWAVGDVFSGIEAVVRLRLFGWSLLGDHMMSEGKQVPVGGDGMRPLTVRCAQTTASLEETSVDVKFAQPLSDVGTIQ